jgi:hypothetical protein
MKEKYLNLSPYNYCANNSVKYIDPDGEDIYIYDKNNSQQYRYAQGQLQRQIDGEWANLETKASDFVEGVKSALDDIYSGGNAGKELISFFDNTDNDTIIRENIEDRNRNLGKINNMNPNLIGGEVPTVNGIEESPFFVSLAHELAHTQDYYININNIEKVTGTWLTLPDGKTIAQSEKYATHIENQIRSENNLPLRTHYVIDKATGEGYPDSRILNKDGSSRFYKTTETIYMSLPLILGGVPPAMPDSFEITYPFKY